MIKNKFRLLNLILAFCLLFSFVPLLASGEIRVNINLWDFYDGEEVKELLKDAGVKIWRIQDGDMEISERKAFVKNNQELLDTGLNKDLDYIGRFEQKDGVVSVMLAQGLYYGRVVGIDRDKIKVSDFVLYVAEDETNENGVIEINPKHELPHNPETPPHNPPDNPPETPPDTPPETPPETPPYGPRGKGRAYFKKIDFKSGKPVYGVVFRVTKEVDGKQQNLLKDGKLFTVKSSEDGCFDCELYYGDYALWEMKQAPGYEQLSDAVYFTVDGDDPRLRLNIENKPLGKRPLPKTGDLVFPMLFVLGAIVFVFGFIYQKKNFEVQKNN